MAKAKSDLSEKKKKAVKAQAEPKSKFSLSKISEFTSDVKTEFGKIAWPSRKHTAGSTVVVIVLVMLFSLYLGAVDLFLGKLVGYILN